MRKLAVVIVLVLSAIVFTSCTDVADSVEESAQIEKDLELLKTRARGVRGDKDEEPTEENK